MLTSLELDDDSNDSSSSSSDDLSNQQQTPYFQKLALQFLGVSCLQVFIQNNFTGPPLFKSVREQVKTIAVLTQQHQWDKFETDVIMQHFLKSSEKDCKNEQDNSESSNSSNIDELLKSIHRKCKTCLTMDAEQCHSKILVPHYLLLSTAILTSTSIQTKVKQLRGSNQSNPDYASFQSISWWIFRNSFVHQRVLMHWVYSLNKRCTDQIENIEREYIKGNFEQDHKTQTELAVRASEEVGIMYNYYQDEEKAQVCRLPGTVCFH